MYLFFFSQQDWKMHVCENINVKRPLTTFFYDLPLENPGIGMNLKPIIVLFMICSLKPTIMHLFFKQKIINLSSVWNTMQLLFVVKQKTPNPVRWTVTCMNTEWNGARMSASTANATTASWRVMPRAAQTSIAANRFIWRVNAVWCVKVNNLWILFK